MSACMRALCANSRTIRFNVPSPALSPLTHDSIFSGAQRSHRDFHMRSNLSPTFKWFHPQVWPHRPQVWESAGVRYFPRHWPQRIGTTVHFTAVYRTRNFQILSPLFPRSLPPDDRLLILLETDALWVATSVGSACNGWARGGREGGRIEWETEKRGGEGKRERKRERNRKLIPKPPRY